MLSDTVYTALAIKVRVAEVAARTWGRISRAQLIVLGVSDGTITQWVNEGYLHRVLPGVYAVGHRSAPIEADLAAALLYAGPGAMLSHATAAWWRKLTERQPPLIHVSTPRQCQSIDNVRVHGRRHLERTWHRGLTVTTVPQTLLDYASDHDFNDVRYVLAEADYQRLVDLEEIHGIAGRGKPGSVMLRHALQVHWPELARTRSRLERAFLALIDEAGLPRPEVNVKVCGYTVDCYWPQRRLVVELDGGKGHSTERQVARDHSKDLTLRAAGITVRRYAERQVLHDGDAVLTDLRPIV